MNTKEIENITCVFLSSHSSKERLYFKNAVFHRVEGGWVGGCDESERGNINKCDLHRDSQFLHEDSSLLIIAGFRD